MPKCLHRGDVLVEVLRRRMEARERHTASHHRVRHFLVPSLRPN